MSDRWSSRPNCDELMHAIGNGLVVPERGRIAVSCARYDAIARELPPAPRPGPCVIWFGDTQLVRTDAPLPRPHAFSAVDL